MASFLSNLCRRIWYYFLVVMFVGPFILTKEFVRKVLGYRMKLNMKEFPTRQGQVAIVTGGAKGIGLEAVKGLLSKGMHVIVVSSSISEGPSPLLQELQKVYADGKVQFWKCDLTSMKEVRLLAERFLKTGLPLHILVCNSGIMFSPFKLTGNQFESHFALNYLSHCLLTKLLLPKLQETGTKEQHARIVNVSSCAHFPGSIYFKDTNTSSNYSAHFAYAQSKLAQIMFTYSLERHLGENSTVKVMSLHPGVVSTDLYRHSGLCSFSFIKRFYLTPQQGAEPILYASLSPELENASNIFIEECKTVSSSRYSRNKDKQDQLWEHTWTLLANWTSEIKY